MSDRVYVPKILLVGGGSGGHFYPLIAIGESLLDTGLPLELYYAGPDAYDLEALRSINAKLIHIHAGKWRRYGSLHNIIDLCVTLIGCIQAVIRLFFLYPDVVVSKGGYTSVPVVLAAAFLRIPIVVHESDTHMGRANKIGARYARSVITNHPLEDTSLTKGTTHVWGIPIRKAIRAAAATRVHRQSEVPTILVLGGSQGAERLNEFILTALNKLLPCYRVFHQTGTLHEESVKKIASTFVRDPHIFSRYEAVGFLTQEALIQAYLDADIVISRAGSNSIYEIALFGLPAILVPIPETVSHDQTSNAYAFAKNGGGIVIEEQNLTDDLLQSALDRIMHNPVVLHEMASKSASFARTTTSSDIAQLIIEIQKEHAI